MTSADIDLINALRAVEEEARYARLRMQQGTHAPLARLGAAMKRVEQAVITMDVTGR